MMENFMGGQRHMIEQLKNFKEIFPGKFDLREIKNIEELDEILEVLIKEKNVLLHGTPNDIEGSLEPRQANDIHREDGNQNAIYATDFPERSIFHAILNRKYLLEKLDSFVSGYSNSKTPDGKLEFEVTQNLKDMIDSDDPEVFCDGWIYLLENVNFNKSEDQNSEYQSTDDIKPKTSLLISRNLGEDIKKRIRVYKPEELNK